MINPALKVPKSEVAAFCRRHHVRALSLFGSATREDFRPDSDVDVLIEFAEGATSGLFELVDMRDELQRIFDRPVDIATSEILRNPYRRQAILKELERVYAE